MPDISYVHDDVKFVENEPTQASLSLCLVIAVRYRLVQWFALGHGPLAQHTHHLDH